jgi:hypothetical protein
MCLKLKKIADQEIFLIAFLGVQVKIVGDVDREATVKVLV